MQHEVQGQVGRESLENAATTEVKSASCFSLLSMAHHADGHGAAHLIHLRSLPRGGSRDGRDS